MCKTIHSTCVAVSSGEASGVTSKDQQFSQNGHRNQSKINAQAAKIATVRFELN